MLGVLSCGGASPGAGTPSPGPGAGTPSPCPQTLAEVCAQPNPPGPYFGPRCNSTPAAAEQDAALCIGTGSYVRQCGAYTVVTAANVDFFYFYYYDSTGALAAITTQTAPWDERCLGGAGTFVIPPATACGASTPSPACALPDGGTSD